MWLCSCTHCMLPQEGCYLMTMIVEAEEGEKEEIQKNSVGLQSPSMDPRSFTLLVDNELVWRLISWLPSMSSCLRTDDWSPQQKALESLESWASNDSNSGIQFVLENEYVAWFVWFLFMEAAPRSKQYATLALTRICSGAYDATKMPTIDNTSRDNLLVSVLYSEILEVQRQASCVLAFVCGSNYVKDLTLEAGVLNRLLELANHDSPRVACPALTAIRFLAKNDKCKLGRPPFNKEWLPSLLGPLNQNYGNPEIEGVPVEACWVVANIVRGHEDNIKAAIDLGLIPLIVKLSSCGDPDLERAAVGAISSVTFGATWLQIWEIVEMGCLKALYAQLKRNPGDCDGLYFDCLVGIENILIAGESGDPYLSGPRNIYAKQINDMEPCGSAIHTFHVLHSSCYLVDEKASELVRTYFVFNRDKSVEWMEDDDEETECLSKVEEGTAQGRRRDEEQKEDNHFVKKRKTNLLLSSGL